MTLTRIAWITTAAATLLAAATAAGQVGAFDAPANEPKVAADALASHTHVTPGQTFHVAVEITIAEGWIYYSPDPGGSEKPKVYGAAIHAEASGRKLDALAILWPPDRAHEYIPVIKSFSF